MLMLVCFLPNVQSVGPMAHVDAVVEGTPGLSALVDDLSRLALSQMQEMGTQAIPNILWSLGILRQNPLGEGVQLAFCT